MPTETEHAADRDLPFQQVADGLPTPCWISDADGQIIWVNAAWLAYTGVDVAAIQSRGLEALHDPVVYMQVRERWDAVKRAGHAAEMTFPLKGRNGGYRLFRTRVVPIRNQKGRIVRWFGTNTDISEQAAVEAELRESQRRLELATEAADLGIWDWNLLDGSFVYSPRAKEICGFEANQTVTYDDVVRATHPDDLPRTSMLAKRALDPAVRSVERYRYRLVRPDGEVRTVEARGRAIFELSPDGAERAVRYVGTIQDVTQTTLLEESTRQSEVLLKSLFDASELYIAVLEVTGESFQYILFNKATAKFYNQPADARSFDARDIGIPGEEVAQWRQTLLDIWATGRPRTMEYAFNGGHGPRWYVGTYTPLPHGPDGLPRISFVVIDATQRKLAEEALRRSEDRLRLATEAGQIGTWDFKPETGELQWDARCRAMFGMPADRLVTYNTFLDALHPDDREHVDRAVQAAISPGGRPDYDIVYRTIGIDDGVERTLSAKGSALFENGRAVRFIGTVIDITARSIAERRLEIVNRTGAAVAAELDLERVVQIVTDAGVELCGAEFGAFFYNVVNAKGESYMLYTLSGAPRSAFSSFPMPRNTEIFAPTFEGQGIVRSDDITRDPRYGRNAPRKGMPEGHLPVTSYLAVPVVARSGEVLGGLFFGHRDAARFDHQSESLVSAVANQAAVAIENARLYAATREANQKLEALNRSLEQRVQDEVAARVSIQERERSTTEQFRLLVQSVVDYAIYMLDLEGNVSTWNAGAERIKGYPSTEVVGKHFSMFYTDEARAGREPWALLEEARRNGRVALEGWRVRKDGTRFWASVVIDTVYDDQGRAVGFAKVTRDVSEQREAAQQLEATREALFQAQKMESIGQLTGGIAHDFNNMLAVVIGALDLMQRRIRSGDMNISRFVDNAMEGAQRAAALTKRLLAFSRRQSLEPSPLDANKLVVSMTELLSRTLGEHIQIETVLSPGLWRCFADAVQLESAILNLAVNARDAMVEGGRLTIDTANASVDAKVAREYAVPEGQYVLIAVTDTGAGMTPEVMSQAFDPFFTTKEVGKGSGLGLSQVFGFVRQSGGHVKLYSELGVGTTVKLYLPRYTGSERTLREEASHGPLYGAESSEVVLVVEDEDRVRTYSVEALQELGYVALTASTPSEALAIVGAGQRVDLLFTDVVMPQMNGRQLAEKAREMMPSLKVLFTTGYTSNAVVHNGILDAGTTVLQKPFTVDELAAKVRKVLDS